MQKRGISPLIASVLLIAFAITIGALIIGWGQGVIEDNADEARQASEREVRCTIGTSLQVKVVSGEKKLCYRNITGSVGRLDFMLENNGDKTIEGLRIVLIGETDEVTTADQDTFEVIGGGVKKGIQNYSLTTLGNISQVEFIPKVTTDSGLGKQICSNRRLKEDNIYECTN